VAATVNACEQRSGASSPDVHLTTSARVPDMPPSCCTVRIMETAYLALLVGVFVAIAVAAAIAVTKLGNR
jgi:hypothetical protein